ncbi:acetyltransferase GNAT family protein [Klosneuvirus KNV1]|uniref:Acetyltransferase GNAT family protein n=1 Tax=Klosneuvirus KNV1 TaxID=1977640 RepID=A0A1V0SI15_9VIRU|nr:acetyltransferase GNAT family protein [Klosneuvirus KNV1]
MNINTNTNTKIRCIEVEKIKNPELLANVVFNNFSYLTEFPELMHNKQEIIKTLNAEGNLCYLIYDKNNLIGYLIGDFRNFPDNRYGYYISYLYISKLYQNRKLGTNLMDKIIKKCRNIGVNYILLTCDTKDEKIVKFYKKYGFVVDSSMGGDKRHNVYCLYIKDL